MTDNGKDAGAVIRVIVDYHTGLDAAKVMGPVDEHPEACIMALMHGAKILAAKLGQERKKASGGLVKVAPVVRLSALVGLLALAGCVKGSPFEPVVCEPVQASVQADSVVFVGDPSTFGKCPKSAPLTEIRR